MNTFPQRFVAVTLVISLLFVAFASWAPAVWATADPDLAAIVRRNADALNRGDVAAVLWPTSPTTRRSSAARHFVRRVHRAWAKPPSRRPSSSRSRATRP